MNTFRHGPGTAPFPTTAYPVTGAFRCATRTRLLKCESTADCVRAVVVMTQVPRLRCTVQE